MRYYPQDHTANTTEFVCTVARFPQDRLGSWLSAIVKSSMDGVIVLDTAHQIVLTNGEAGRLFGHAPDQLLAQPLDILLPPHLLAEHHTALRRLIHARGTGRRLRIRFESTGLHSSGDEFPVEASISRVTVRSEPFLVIILRELRIQAGTHQRLRSAPAEFQRRAVTSQQAHEVEKKRFSRVLYDDLGQSLSVLKLDMDWLQLKLIPSNTAALQYVTQMQVALDRIIVRTRSLASTLRPPLLDDFGLVAAVQWVADDFQKKTGIRCQLKNQGNDQKAGDLIESAVFRLIQESLLNVERHAQASTVMIFLWQNKNSLDVLIQDDGIGLARGSGSKPGCFGLIAMQERIYTLGGTISIHNAESHGLAIRASIPVDSI